MRLIGGHQSSEGGVQNACKEAGSMGHNVFQCFLDSPMKMVANPSSVHLGMLKALLLETGRVCVTHGSYLLNLADTKPEGPTDTKSKMIRKMLYQTEECGGTHLVLHSGSCVDGVRAGLDNMALRVFFALDGYKGEVQLSLENGCGGGNNVGSMRGLRWVVEQVDDKRLGICFDTAHAYASGIDLAKKQTIRKLLLYREHIKVLHLNDPDTKVELGKHLDRHNCVFGEGNIGKKALLTIAKYMPEIVPIIVEMTDRDATRRNAAMVINKLEVPSEPVN